MAIEELLFIALAVSLDAFGVAIAVGLYRGAKARQKLSFAISFGFFQFLFSILGGFGGKIFTENIASVPAVIGGIVIAIVGILMIKEGMIEKEESIVITFKMYFILGISVSIDAIVIGFIAFSRIESMVTLTLFTAIVGMITFFMSILAFIIAKYLRRIHILRKYADYIGGIILILFGLKMIFF
ncbi:manganese efflux pump MntP family protein [Clostridium sp.]|uniref:manganese efflux pump MntP family protein n=1 Tax=Clostridium sp. TaxID=1506 RepID=UPI0034649416